jgi:EAL domain-containing protein (putative c-di-GMP-specific phosphodiesterase class I)
MTDKLLICLESSTMVSEKYLAEIEDACSKLLNLQNTLMMEENIAADVLSNENLMLDVTDLLNSNTLNTELILTVINFTSIVSF